ncbi:AMP-binding protein, partial [Bacillus sp. JR_15]
MKREDLIAPEQYNLVSEIEAFSHDKEKKALHWQDGNGYEAHVTYASLVEEANKIGHVLLNAGFKKGDKIIVMVPRMLEAYSIYLAILKTGMVVIPCSEMLRAKDLDYRIEHAEAKGAIVYSSFIQSFDGTNQPNDFKTFSIGENDHGWTNILAEKDHQSSELPMAPTTRTDMAFLSYTSGTTGNPKGVVHTHGWAYAHLRTAAKAWLSINEGDKVWATAGPGWQKWVWSPLLSVLGSGAEGFVYGGKFNPNTYLELLQKNEINVLCCTPTEYRFMAKVDDLSQYELPKLHSAVSAGEPLNREVIDTFKKHFDIEVRDGYGQTESTLLVGVLKGMDIKPGSMGK